MGVPETQDFLLATESVPTSPVGAVDEAISLALGNRIEISLAGLNRQGTQIDLNLARGLAAPMVTVSGGATLNYDLANNKAGTVFSAGLKFGIPILDGGLLQQQEAASTALLGAYESQASQLSLSIRAEVQEAFNSWKLNVDKYQLAQDTEEQMLLLKQIAQAKSDAGVLNLSDRMTADLNYTTAQFARTKAKITMELSALQLVVKLGLQEK